MRRYVNVSVRSSILNTLVSVSIFCISSSLLYFVPFRTYPTCWAIPLRPSDSRAIFFVTSSVKMLRFCHASIVRSCRRPRFASELILSYPGRKTLRLKIGQPTASPHVQNLSACVEFFLCLVATFPKGSCTSYSITPSPILYPSIDSVILFGQLDEANQRCTGS
jgi:hypothetical protein